jgi:Arc/MetJ-type ribon-helix-helix transcriptional regulator
MATSNTLSFTVPNDLKIKLEGITKTGYYDSLSEFLRDAIRSTLTQNKDLRIALAFELYKQEKITLGKAAEIIQESPEEVKALFKAREL